MEELTAEAFDDWLRAADVIEHYHQRREPDPKGLVLSMLCDGFLRAAAGRMIVNGDDLGLALIPRELWPAIGRTWVWATDRFRVQSEGRIVSGYDVRIDRETGTPCGATASPTAERPPLPESVLPRWSEAFRAGNPDASEAAARRGINASFPAHFVSRDRLRRIMPPKRRGRPLKNND